MSAWVMIILIAQTSYDGGMAATYVPFATEAACVAAKAAVWHDYTNKDPAWGTRLPREISVTCAATGAK